jgi:hypothetical protein
MKSTLIIVASLAAAPALASAQHTVMWYVGHPAETKTVLAACHNDPGDAKNTPDCENAFQAEIVISTAKDEQHANLLVPPSDPRYWRIHPEELPWKLYICPKLSPAIQKDNFCDSAWAAVKQ